MINSGLKEKITNNLFSKFIKVTNKWFKFIDISFLPKEMKKQYKLIIQNKLERLVK